MRCHYCDTILPLRYELDHFPVPGCAGGTETVPVCLTCHDLKDRVALKNWPLEAVANAVEDLTPYLDADAEMWFELDDIQVMDAWPSLGTYGRLLYGKVRREREIHMHWWEAAS